MDKDRNLAYQALKSIEKSGSWSNLALGRLSGGKSDSPAFVREIVYGVLRNRMLLDYNIDRFLKRPKIGLAERIILRLGFYQLVFMDSVPDYAAVNTSVELAGVYAKSAKGLVNAVLHSFIRDGKALRLPDPSGCTETERMSLEYSCSPWIIDLWTKAYGAERTLGLLKASNTPAPLAIRANRLRNTRDDLAEILTGKGFDVSFSEICGTSLRVRGKGLLDLEEFAEGRFSVQGEASQLAAELLDAKSGDTVIDMCAAPGGKSCAIAEAMEDRGNIYAFDLYPERVKLIEASAARLGLKSIRASAADASKPLTEAFRSIAGAQEGSARTAEGSAGSADDKVLADRVLCDVPCSGLGTLRQKPEIKLKERPLDLDLLPDIQLKILKNGADHLKTGGKLVYSTCTVDPAENVDIVTRFLAENKGFELTFEKQFFTEENGPDGFYIAVLVKSK